MFFNILVFWYLYIFLFILFSFFTSMLYNFLTLTFFNILYKVLPTLVYFSKKILNCYYQKGHSLIKDDEKQNYC